MDVEQIARVCHEANRALQIETGFTPVSVGWDDLDEHTRESACTGVEHVITHDPTPQESHESWSLFKLGAGWRYGPVKDEQKQEHPNLVPYDELPAVERAKDSLFGAIVRALKDVEA